MRKVIRGSKRFVKSEKEIRERFIKRAVGIKRVV